MHSEQEMRATFRKAVSDYGDPGAWAITGRLWLGRQEIGTLTALLVDLYRFKADPWDALDAESADAAEIREILPRRIPAEWGGILALQQMKIQAGHRGQGRGPWFMQQCLNRFSDDFTFVGLKAWPIGKPQSPTSERASQRIAAHWKKVGFVHRAPHGLMAIQPKCFDRA
jgi:hypothetical protein